MEHFIINSTIKQPVPNLPLGEIKDKILGKRYYLTLNYIGSTRAHSLNVANRNKEYTPNVLTFPLTDDTGEIYICPEVSARQAKKFNLSPEGHLALLFIHGLLHLKGVEHGDTMEKMERKYLTTFNLS